MPFVLCVISPFSFPPLEKKHTFRALRIRNGISKTNEKRREKETKKQLTHQKSNDNNVERTILVLLNKEKEDFLMRVTPRMKYSGKKEAKRQNERERVTEMNLCRWCALNCSKSNVKVLGKRGQFMEMAKIQNGYNEKYGRVRGRQRSTHKYVFSRNWFVL